MADGLLYTGLYVLAIVMVLTIVGIMGVRLLRLAMANFTTRRAVLAVTLALILLAFFWSEGCGPRYERISSLAFSPDGKRLAVAKHDARDANNPLKGYLVNVCRTVSVLRVPSLRTESVVEQDLRRGNQGPAFDLFHYAGNSLAFTHNSNTLAVLDFGGGNVKSYDLDLSQMHVFIPNAMALHVNADRTVLMTVTDWPKKTTLWNATTGEELRAITTTSFLPFPGAPSVAISPDAELIATSEWPGVRLLNTEDGTQRAVLKGVRTREPFRLTFSPAEEQVAVASRWWLRLYDFDGNQTAKLDSGREILATRFSPDGKGIAAALDRGIEVFEIRSGKRLHALRSGESTTCLEYSPDGAYLAAGHADGRVTLWSIGSGKRVARVKPPGRYRLPWTVPALLLVIWALAKRWTRGRDSLPQVVEPLSPHAPKPSED